MGRGEPSAEKNILQDILDDGDDAPAIPADQNRTDKRFRVDTDGDRSGHDRRWTEASRPRNDNFRSGGHEYRSSRATGLPYSYSDPYYRTGYHHHPPHPTEYDHRRPPPPPNPNPYYADYYDEKAAYYGPPSRKRPRENSPAAAPRSSSHHPDYQQLDHEQVSFFTARCNYYDQFVKCKRDGIWRAPSYVAQPMERALKGGSGRVLLLFSVHGSQYFQGIAEIDQSRGGVELSGREGQLSRIHLRWLIVADVGFNVLPNVPGLIQQDQSVKESFLIPRDQGRALLPLFERAFQQDHTASLGASALQPFL